MKLLFLTEHDPKQRNDLSDKARYLIKGLVSHAEITYCNPVTMVLPNFSDFDGIIVQGFMTARRLLGFLLSTSIPIYYIMEEWFAYKGKVSKTINLKDQPSIEHEDTMAEMDLCNKAKHVFVRSELMRKHLLERYVPIEKVSVLVPSYLNPKEYTWQVGFAGDCSDPIYGFDFVLTLAKEMPDVEFRIFGQVQDEQIKKASPNVMFYGNPPNLVENLSHCHFLLLPYINNKMNQIIPQSFVYYLHAGKPILFSGIEELKQINASSTIGMDVARDVKAYKGALEILFESPDMRVAMESNALSKSLDFSKNAIEKMIATIKEPKEGVTHEQSKTEATIQ